MMTPETKAKQLGATAIEGGINWVWASGFPTESKAREFVTWLNSQCIENRGVYGNGDVCGPHAGDKGQPTDWSVRYR